MKAPDTIYLGIIKENTGAPETFICTKQAQGTSLDIEYRRVTECFWTQFKMGPRTRYKSQCGNNNGTGIFKHGPFCSCGGRIRVEG